MREIKFRGKTTECDTWVYGSLIIDNKGTYISDMQGVEADVIPETVGQFIGRKDSDGIDGYDSDIITFYKGYVDDSWTDCEQGKAYVIKWVDRDGYLGYYAQRENKSVQPFANTIDSKFPWTWKVIGNTHDNPELLTK